MSSSAAAAATTPLNDLMATLGEIQVVETHISQVFLVGDAAYKIKKPVNFGFVDFSTLEKRHTACEKEVALNRRTAPDLYLDVIAITDEGGQLAFNGKGPVVEYAVHMRRFDENHLLSTLLKNDGLSEDILAELTDHLVDFYKNAEQTPNDWSPDVVEGFALDNVTVLRSLASDYIPAEQLNKLEAVTRGALASNRNLMKARQKTHVKACHGDLHLGNICLWQGKAMPFDCIEFNDSFSHGDVLVDLAFLLMDLDFKKRPDLSNLVLNRYLKRSDDFDGLPLLNFYLSYRAAVRAKVSALQLGHAEGKLKQTLIADCQNYTTAALNYLLPKAPQPFIGIGGLSGSGKSTLGKEIAQRIHGIQIRADAVRKHIAGVDVATRAPQSAYTYEMNKQTYAGMRNRAHLATTTGMAIIMDAVHASEDERDAVEALAHELGRPFTGLWCAIPTDMAKRRIDERRGDISDATSEVYEKQLLLDTGRISWHRIDTSYGTTQVANRVMDLLKLGENRP